MLTYNARELKMPTNENFGNNQLFELQEQITIALLTKLYINANFKGKLRSFF